MRAAHLVLVLSFVAACRAKAKPAPPAAAAPVHITHIFSTGATESAGVVAARIDARSVVFVADADDRAIVTVDATTLAPLARTDLGTPPRDLLVTKDGALLATLPEANAVAVLEPAGAEGALHLARKIDTSTEPLAVAMSLDGAHVAVTAGAAHRVDVLDGRTLVTERTHEVLREPRAAIVGKHGLLFVTHAAAGKLSVLRLDPSAPAAPESGDVDLGIRATAGDPQRFARHAEALVRIASGEGERLLVPLVQNAPKEGAPPGGGYGGGGGSLDNHKLDVVLPSPDPFDGEAFVKPKMVMAARPRTPAGGPPNRMSAFDVRSIDSATATRTLDSRRHESVVASLLHECLLPRAAVLASKERLVVACEGGDHALALDATAAYPRVVGTLATGRGPSAIARLDEGRIVVWAPLARALSTFDVTTDGDRTPAATRTLPRVRAIDATVLRGRELFHRSGDTRVAADGLACASCHPDGRDDDLVWASPRGDRRTRTLAGNAGRPSTFGWGGEHATFAVHVKETVRRLRGTGLPEEDLDALYAYVRSMRPLPAADVPDDAEEKRGALVFASDRAACASCHDPANGFTDHERHRIDGALMVTPSLLGAGARTALFHDGRFGSVDTFFRSETDMGGLAKLTPDEKRDLSAFLKTL